MLKVGHREQIYSRSSLPLMDILKISVQNLTLPEKLVSKNFEQNLTPPEKNLMPVVNFSMSGVCLGSGIEFLPLTYLSSALPSDF